MFKIFFTFSSFNAIMTSWFLLSSLNNNKMDYRRGCDLLSDLPLSIIHIILSFVPFKDTVRTSIISRNWRYTWTSLPHLEFDGNCFNLDNKSRLESEKCMENFITQALFHHKGPIHKCKMYLPFYTRDPEVDKWILCLSRNDIRELTLNDHGSFQLYSNIYSCKKLTRLELHFCDLYPPPLNFNGFLFLRCLVLKRVHMLPQEIECLVANCPLLERFELSLDIESRLRFSAPNLKYLDLFGDFVEIRVCAPLLADVSVKLVYYDTFRALQQERRSSVCNYTDFFDGFGGLINLEKLRGRFCFTKYLSRGIESCHHSLVFHHLKVIDLEYVNFGDTRHILVVARLMIDAPNLRELKLGMGWYTADFEDVSLSDFERATNFLTLEKLRVVEVTRVIGRSCNKEFIKFLLRRSPVLETMNVGLGCFICTDGIEKLKDELVGCNRASPSVKICIGL